MRWVILTVALIVLIAFSVKAQFQWGKSYLNAYAQSLSPGDNGSLYVAGSFNDSISLDSYKFKAAHLYSNFICKYDAGGKVLWATQLKGDSDNGISALTSDSKGNLYVTVYFFGKLFFHGDTLDATGLEQGGFLLIKYDSEGELLWKKDVSYGDKIDFTQQIQLDAMGNVYLLKSDLSNNLYKTRLLKFSANGNLIWSSVISGQTSGGDGFFMGIIMTVDNEENIHIEGDFFGPMASIGDLSYADNAKPHIIVNCNLTGNPQSIFPIGRLPDFRSGYGLTSDAFGNLYNATIRSDDHTFLRKFDKGGNEIWSLKGTGLDGSDTYLGNSNLELDERGDIFLAGHIYSPFTIGNTKFNKQFGISTFVLKFSNQGDLIWAVQGQNENYDQATLLGRDLDTGSIYMGGMANSDGAQFGEVTLEGSNSQNYLFFLRLGDADYKPLQLNAGRDTTLCPGSSYLLKANGFQNYLWQDNSQDSLFTANSPGVYTVAGIDYLGNFHYDTVTIKPCFEATIPNVITPNGDALNDNFVVNRDLFKELRLIIYNRWGKEVYSTGDYQNNWRGDGVSSGVYFYKLIGDDKSIFRGWLQVIKEDF